MRAFFFGHVLLELLLDAALVERDPEVLPRYYESLAQVDPDVGQAAQHISQIPARR